MSQHQLAGFAGVPVKRLKQTAFRKGSSIKYVTLFWPILTPVPLSHFVTHPETPKSTSHISDYTLSPIFSRRSTETLTKALCTNSLSIVRGDFYPGFCLLSGRFCPFPFSQNACVTTES